MNNILLTIRKTGRMTCAWVPTGNPRTPLACVWKDTESSLAVSTVQSAPTDEAGGMRLCA
jgi:hypothetical protein